MQIHIFNMMSNNNTYQNIWRYKKKPNTKEGLYNKGSNLCEPTSQYGDLNILWNCLYILVDLVVYHHSWVVWDIGLVNCRSQVPTGRRLLLKITYVIFSLKSYMSIDFWTFISIICYLIFHHQTISFQKFYPGMLSHLKEARAGCRLKNRLREFLKIFPYVIFMVFQIYLYVKNHTSPWL